MVNQIRVSLCKYVTVLTGFRVVVRWRDTGTKAQILQANKAE